MMKVDHKPNIILFLERIRGHTEAQGRRPGSEDKEGRNRSDAPTSQKTSRIADNHQELWKESRKRSSQGSLQE